MVVGGFLIGFIVLLFLLFVSALDCYGQDFVIVDDISGDGLVDLLVGVLEAILDKLKVRVGVVYVHVGMV